MEQLAFKKFIIFDLDGVLVNSTPLVFDKIKIILDRLGICNNRPLDFIKGYFGKKSDDFYNLVCDEIGISDEQRELFLKMEPEVALMLPYEFSRELLEAIMNLKIFGYRVGLLTNRTNRSLESISEQVSLNLALFDKLQTTNHCFYCKPDGRTFGPFLNWAEARNIRHDEILYIGDTLNADFAATQNSNPKIDFVGVISGATSFDDYRNAGLPPCRIVDYEKLPQYLMNIIKSKCKLDSKVVSN